MRTLLALILSLTAINFSQAQERPQEMQFEVAQIVPEGLVVYVYKKATIGGGSGLGGYVGTEWRITDDIALVKGYAKQNDIAEGEKFTIRAVKEGVEKINDGISERSLRVYRVSL